MRTALTRAGVGTAALAVAAASVLAATPAVAAPGEGTVTITWFEDRTTDGVFDPSIVNPAGDADRVRDSASYLYLHTADGEWYVAPQNADGNHVFPNVAVGEAELYVTDPNASSRSVAFWDATAPADLSPMPQTPFSFTDGTFLFLDGTTLDGRSSPGTPGGRGTFTITEGDNAPRLVGMAGIAANAEVTQDGVPTSDAAELEFFENGTAVPAVAWQAGQYYAEDGSYQKRFVPDAVGIAVDPARGFRVESVTASSNINSTLSIDLTEENGIWTANTADLPSFTDAFEFDIALAPVPLTDLSVSYFNDNALDGVLDETVESPTGEIDTKRTTGYAYIQDAQGDWYATIANADGDFVFSGIPTGAATLHVGVPNSYVSTAVWNATDLVDYTDLITVEQPSITFTGGTYLAPDGSEAPIAATDLLTAALPLELAAVEAHSVEVGSASVNQSATVTDEAGAPFADAEVLLFANDTVLETVELETAQYAAIGDLAPADFGIVAAAPTGFEIDSVQAFSAITGAELEVETVVEIDEVSVSAIAGGYTVSPGQLSTNFDGVEWAVSVAPAAVVVPEPETPGTPGSGSTPTGGSLAVTGAEHNGAIGGGLAALLLIAGAGIVVVCRRLMA